MRDMREDERVRWDVTIPNAGKSRKGERVKTVISALVLLALLAGPALIRDDKGGSKAGRPAGDAGAEVAATHTAADSAGTQYERYFPGRQTM
jgi:hypothetical protein